MERKCFTSESYNGANLSGANLNGTQLIRTDFRHADLTGSSIYGIAAWDVRLNADTQQENLIITPPGEPVIMVDNIKVAQFIYLLLNMIPFVPILQDGETGFSMFSNRQTKYDWVIDTLGYDSSENLIAVLDDAVINPALEKRHELELRKARHIPTRHVGDYRKKRPSGSLWG